MCFWLICIRSSSFTWVNDKDVSGHDFKNSPTSAKTSHSLLRYSCIIHTHLPELMSAFLFCFFVFLCCVRSDDVHSLSAAGTLRLLSFSSSITLLRKHDESLMMVMKFSLASSSSSSASLLLLISYLMGLHVIMFNHRGRPLCSGWIVQPLLRLRRVKRRLPGQKWRDEDPLRPGDPAHTHTWISWISSGINKESIYLSITCTHTHTHTHTRPATSIATTWHIHYIFLLIATLILIQIQQPLKHFELRFTLRGGTRCST